ncbi:hypothetical protein [Aestuariivirga sp.]|uniref:hypothetical protein n=1 Tax=Aestuariivirga sp. TaxID=2650926 RepID=UPI003BA9D630
MPIDDDVFGSWQPLLPHQGKLSDLLTWWSTLGDPSLTSLIELALRASPTPNSASATITKARALQRDGNIIAFPAASWERKLFGEPHTAEEIATPLTDESFDGENDCQVSLAAEVADHYIRYKSSVLLANIHMRDVVSRQKTVRALERAAASGLASPQDLVLARGRAAESSSALVEQRTLSRNLVRAMAQLAGGNEDGVRLILTRGKRRIPLPKDVAIIAIPAATLRQRPDIRALEKKLAAALSDSSHAEADIEPYLNLSGWVTFSTSALAGGAPLWSFGPALRTAPVEKGESRVAVVSTAPGFAALVALYKLTVLNAVAETEAALLRIDAICGRVITARAEERYLPGATSTGTDAANLPERETSSCAAEKVEFELIHNCRDAVRCWIAVYRTSGGGWDANLTLLSTLQPLM